jgi:hypothetical protein
VCLLLSWPALVDVVSSATASLPRVRPGRGRVAMDATPAPAGSTTLPEGVPPLRGAVEAPAEPSEREAQPEPMRQPEPEAATLPTAVEYARHGIAVEALEAFLREHAERGALTADSTTSDACHALVKPATVPSGWVDEPEPLIIDEHGNDIRSRCWYKHRYRRREGGEAQGTAPPGTRSYCQLLLEGRDGPSTRKTKRPCKEESEGRGDAARATRPGPSERLGHTGRAVARVSAARSSSTRAAALPPRACSPAGWLFGGAEKHFLNLRSASRGHFRSIPE